MTRTLSAHKKRRTMLGVGLPTAAAALAIGLGLGGATFALWVSSDDFSGGTAVAGDLRLNVTDAPVWERVTAPAGVITADSPAITVPGDVLRVTAPVTSFLRGDNLAAGFTVDFAHAVTDDETLHVHDNVEVTLSVLDGTGTLVAGPAPLGQVAEVSGLVGSSEGLTHNHTLVLDIEVLGDLLWTHQLDPTTPEPDHALWLGGNLAVSLAQVREGAGFAGVTP